MVEEMIGIIVGLVCCLMIIIALTIAVCWYGEENSKLRRENRRLRRTLADYQRLEEASLNAYIALAWEAQRQIGNRQS